MELSVILTYVVCGCCALLCVVVLYLCVTVRRIRRDLNELARNGNLIYTEAVKGDNKDGKDNNSNRNRMSSAAQRYTVEPSHSKPANRRSAVRPDPEETITYLTRPGEEAPPRPATKSTAQTAGSVQENIPLQFVNVGFDPNTTNDGRSSSSSDSQEEDNPQPIYSNDDNEQPIYENTENAIDEPIYVNRGDLADLNNPDLHRAETMDISQF